MTTTQISFIRMLASELHGWENVWVRVKGMADFSNVSAEQVRRIVLDRGK